MAYRKKTVRRRRSAPKRKSTRRRRIGGVSTRKANVTRLLGLVAGAVAPSLLGNIKVGGSPIDAKIVGAASVAIGYLLPGFVKGDLVAGIGDGLIAGGGVMLLNEFNVLNGIPIIAGWKEMNTINGPGPTQQPIREVAQASTFRPTAAQIMRGVYNKRRDD